MQTQWFKRCPRKKTWIMNTTHNDFEAMSTQYSDCTAEGRTKIYEASDPLTEPCSWSLVHKWSSPLKDWRSSSSLRGPVCCHWGRNDCSSSLRGPVCCHWGRNDCSWTSGDGEPPVSDRANRGGLFSARGQEFPLIREFDQSRKLDQRLLDRCLTVPRGDERGENTDWAPAEGAVKVLFEGRVGKIVEALDIREADGIVSLGVEPGAGSGPLFDPAANSNRSLRRLRRLVLPAPRRL